MNLFRDIEKRIDSQLKKLFSSQQAETQGRELIEIQRAILDELEDRAQLLPRAKRRFPYNDLLVRIAAAEEDRRTAIDVVFAQGDTLQNEIRNHLRKENIDFPADLRVRVEALAEAPPEIAAKGFLVTYSSRESAQPGVAAPASQRTVRLSVLHGEAEQPEYQITRSRIHLGRLTEVLDERRRPVRRNDIAFRESAEKPNSTISRAHAHIEFDETAGEFRLFDDGSAYGTSVIHDGRLIEVPPAGGRGVRISSGDEIYLGQARLLFELE